MEQFIKLDTKLLKNEELGLKEKVIYSLLCDRMISSKKRISFYDEDEKDYYVIFTVEELSDLLHLAKGTVVSAYKKLVTLGYAIKKRQFNSGTKVFLPKFDAEKYVKENDDNNDDDNNENSNIETPENQNLKSNHNHSTHNKTKETEDTKETDKNEKISKEALDVAKDGLISRGGFDEHTAGVLATYAFGNSDRLYNLAGIIYKAKSNVRKACHATKDALTIELSDYFADMAQTTKKIILHAKNAKNFEGYIYMAFKGYFEDAVRYYNATMNPSKEDGGIPMFKIA